MFVRLYNIKKKGMLGEIGSLMMNTNETEQGHPVCNPRATALTAKRDKV